MTVFEGGSVGKKGGSEVVRVLVPAWKAKLKTEIRSTSTSTCALHNPGLRVFDMFFL